MNPHITALRRTALMLIVLLVCFSRSYANLNAIDLTKVRYPKELQAQIDQLIADQKMYATWVPEWKETVAKDEVIARLTALSKELEKLPANNIETKLLLGDIAHFLYNMDAKDAFQKAVDTYEAAKKIAPNDYRAYWFLGHHYALSAVTPKAIKSFREAVAHQPLPKTASWFWADYANACTLADMPSTALYAAHQSSVAAGARTYAETMMQGVRKTSLHAPPIDTLLEPNQMWFLTKRKADTWKYTNWALGIDMCVDSTWNIRPYPYKDKNSFAMIIPPQIKSVQGPTIGYSMLITAGVAKPNESLEDFLVDATIRHTNKDRRMFDVGGFKNCIAFEMTDSRIYPQWGGARMYAIAVESDRAEYPGMAFEEAIEKPVSTNGQVTYYRSKRTFGRFNTKMRYLILLDSCEFIKNESMVAFKDFLSKSLKIE
ncbi:tetratricopeptide repeat protein [Mucilaginibacter myungsuensis]|uniref:Tetratricopeptide repeat protein n=1 Tax=Mucilaginibacter myungsuensis TaxID=649104 RepID=A0A929PXN8_9SPHI|nr:hypothetical protein [Mucilaginibacter myungsuensis]MBE9664053.1 hypothetical protein [Mucilaginibacter myungsuensis]MDN3601231.1 hypothetical protein [Mucilaginibacter myungsuensis]